MNVLVIGAAGRTSKAVVEQALAAGHQVTAFVHQAGDYAVPNVRVVAGDATDPVAMAAAVAGQDAVLDTIGGKTPYKTTTLEAGVARAIIAAMRQHGVRRLVVTSMLGVGDSIANSSLLLRLLVATFCAARTRTKRRWKTRQKRAIWIGSFCGPPFLPMTRRGARCGYLRPPRARKPTKSPAPTWPRLWSPN
ncbi:MAG: NAD(P)-binding oxidoreductase [Hymenobacter sp.]